MVNLYKNVIKNILFHNLIKEELKWGLEGICMPSLLLLNLPTAQGEMYLLVILVNLYSRIYMAAIIKMVNLKLTNLRSIEDLLREHLFIYSLVIKIVQIKSICPKDVSNGW